VVKNKALNLLPWRCAQPKFIRHCPHSQFHSESAQGCRKGRGRREAWCNQSSGNLGTPRFGTCGLSSSWPWELALTPSSVHRKGGTTCTAHSCFEETWSAGCFRMCDAEITIAACMNDAPTPLCVPRLCVKSAVCHCVGAKIGTRFRSVIVL
jgi:hypothetical protein